jgi:hypothetical protein
LATFLQPSPQGIAAMTQKFMYIVALVDLSSCGESRPGPEHVSFEHTVITAKDADDAYAQGLAWVTTHLPHADRHVSEDSEIPAA